MQHSKKPLVQIHDITGDEGLEQVNGGVTLDRRPHTARDLGALVRSIRNPFDKINKPVPSTVMCPW